MHKHRKIRIIQASVVILLAAVSGSLVNHSHAATYVTAKEAESGTPSGNYTAGDTVGASGNASVRFGASTPAPTPPPPSQTCTNPSHTIPMNSSNPQDGISIGNFYITNDTWNAAGYPVSQTMYICDYNNWYVTATMNNNSNDGAVKTYPNVHQDFNNAPKISSFKTISSSFAETSPHVGIYEWAYDMWLNGVASSGSTEVMIWNDNYKQTPGGSKQTSVSFDGRTYDVYKSGSYIAFVDTVNTTSGTVNILSFFNYIISKGWVPSTSTVGQIDYGVELVSTNDTPAKYQLNGFSLTTN